jgi:hypothetical protein
MSSQSSETLTKTISGQFRDSNQDNFGTISGLQLRSPGKKSHFDVAPTKWRKEYYMGEGGGFPQVWAVVSLVCHSARGLSQHSSVGSRECLQVPYFRNSTHLDPQVGSTRNLGVRQNRCFLYKDQKIRKCVRFEKRSIA